MNTKARQRRRTWTRRCRRALRAMLLMVTSVFAIIMLPLIILGLVANVLSYDATGHLPVEAAAPIHHLSPKPA